MANTLKLSFAAALFASLLGGTASAEGDYYEGAAKRASAVIDSVETGSIAGGQNASAMFEIAAVDSGEYYHGANRPN